MENICYKNKLFSVLGDSVSTLDKYTEPQDAAFYEGVKKFEADVFSPSDTWWGIVADSLGAKILVNNSFSGCCVTKRTGVMIPSFGCCDERTSSLHQENVVPDVIMVSPKLSPSNTCTLASLRIPLVMVTGCAFPDLYR